MTYNIRCLAKIYSKSVSLLCTLHIVIQAAKWYFTSETMLSTAFYYRVSIECSFMMLKSQQMVLHANLQSKMVLTIFIILLGVLIFNSL